MSLIKRFYAPTGHPTPYDPNKVYDFVVPLDYGCLPKGNKARNLPVLPDAEIKALTIAAALVRDHCALRIRYGNTGTFGLLAAELHREKLEELGYLGAFPSEVDDVGECSNSITECLQIIDGIPATSSIVIVGDWRHTRRALRIWRHYFKGEVAVINVDGRWDENHPSVWCKPRFGIPGSTVFLGGNLIHHSLLVLKGPEALRGAVHAVSTTA